MKWEVPTLISQYKQDLNKDTQIPLLLTCVDFTTLKEWLSLDSKINTEIHGTEDT